MFYTLFVYRFRTVAFQVAKTGSIPVQSTKFNGACSLQRSVKSLPKLKGGQADGSIPSGSTKHMESNAAGLVLRLALKTRFSEMGWGSTPLLSAKFCCYRLSVRTLPFQGGKRGSIPRSSTNHGAFI
jgi:hypothetical protein